MHLIDNVLNFLLYILNLVHFDMRVHFLTLRELFCELLGLLLDGLVLLFLSISFLAFLINDLHHTLQLSFVLLFFGFLPIDFCLDSHGIYISIRVVLPFLQVNLIALV